MREKIKILIIDNSISFTGAFRAALNEAVLLKREYEFIFLVSNGSAVTHNIEEAGFTCYTLPLVEISRSPKNLITYLPALWKNARKLSKILKQEQVDIIQVNDCYNLLGVTAKLLGFKGRVITYVRFLPSALPVFLRKTWLGLAQRFSYKVVAVSDAVLRQLPAHPKNLRIYDPVSFSETLPVKQFTSSTRPVIFLYLGNYIRGKGQNWALEAFRQLSVKGVDTHLKFVGGDMGLQKNKDYKKTLEQYVINHQLTDMVTFHSFTPDVEKEIKAADIVLNFSEAESFSMTCLEASFYGVPVIATRCGGPEEIIENEHTGLLVENKNIQAMADAMETLAASTSLREQFGSAGAKYVREKFSKEEFVTGLEGVLN